MAVPAAAVPAVAALVLVNAGVVTEFVTEQGEFDVAVALTDG